MCYLSRILVLHIAGLVKHLLETENGGGVWGRSPRKMPSRFVTAKKFRATLCLQTKRKLPIDGFLKIA
jgi:hypothetical protein